MSTNGTTPQFDQFFTSKPSRPQVPRLVVNVDGLDKCGKTYYAIMTTPGPVAVVYHDPGTATVIAKARAAGRIIHEMAIDWEIPDPNIVAAANVDKMEHQNWYNAWDKLKKAHQAIIANPSIRTLVWDTATEVKNLCGTMNADFTKLFWDLYNKRPDLNMLFIHKVGKQYIKGANPNAPSEWTGGYDRKGYSDIGYMADMSLWCGWDKVWKNFYTCLDDRQATRFGAELISKKWFVGGGAREGGHGESAFWNLAMEVFPETMLTPEVWGQ
jgi:hypothetical protein